MKKLNYKINWRGNVSFWTRLCNWNCNGSTFVAYNWLDCLWPCKLVMPTYGIGWLWDSSEDISPRPVTWSPDLWLVIFTTNPSSNPLSITRSWYSRLSYWYLSHDQWDQSKMRSRTPLCDRSQTSHAAYNPVYVWIMVMTILWASYEWNHHSAVTEITAFMTYCKKVLSAEFYTLIWFNATATSMSQS